MRRDLRQSPVLHFSKASSASAILKALRHDFQGTEASLTVARYQAESLTGQCSPSRNLERFNRLNHDSHSHFALGKRESRERSDRRRWSYRQDPQLSARTYGSANTTFLERQPLAGVATMMRSSVHGSPLQTLSMSFRPGAAI